MLYVYLFIVAVYYYLADMSACYYCQVYENSSCCF